ncbi:MAG: (d)CMP kinase [Clostridia bacterium]|nr:(d)CMP kinase [Clostridia bacterium]
MIIAIDGTSGSGKSTLAKKLAKKLNFGFFSAGSLYRTITLKALNLHIRDDEDDKLQYMIEHTEIIYSYDGEKSVMLLDGIDVADQLHNEEISTNVAKYACKPYIREFVRTLQRDTQNHNENIVMEGRDIGSVIFPNAEMKIYVDCNVKERAKRRFKDYAEKDPNITMEEVLEALKDRDYKDMHREISPLIMCEDAYLIDSTLNSVNDCIELAVAEMIRRNLITRDQVQETNN